MPDTPREQARTSFDLESFRKVVEQRDHLFLLQEAIGEVEKARTLPESLRVLVDAIRRIGYGRVTITLRDERLDPTLTVTAGLTPGEEQELIAGATTGESWRRRLAGLERFRISQSYYLDSADPYIAREFGAESIASALEEGEEGSWNPHDALLVPLRGASGQIIATLVLDDPVDRARPTLESVRIVELFGQQAASIIDRVRLTGIAQRRAERLQLLQESGAAFAMSLDAGTIVRELAMHGARALRAEVSMAACVDLDTGEVSSGVRRHAAGDDRWNPAPLACEAVLDILRTGSSVRVRGESMDPAAATIMGELAYGASTAGSALISPVSSAAERVAIVAVWSPSPSGFNWEDEDLLVTMAGQAGAAVVNARLYAESLRERRIGEALAEVARAVNAAVRRGDLMPFILRHAAALLRVDGATLSLLRDDEIEVVSGIGSGEVLLGHRLPMNASLTGRVVREGIYCISNDVAQEPSAYQVTRQLGGIRKLLIVPLFGPEGTIGALSVHNPEHDFTEEEAIVLQRFADQVAVALVNARLFEEERRAREAMQKSEARYARVVEAASDAIITMDPEGRLTSLNPSLERSVGRRCSELLGLSFRDLLDPGDTQGYDQIFADAIAGRRRRAFVRYPSATGELRQGSVILTPMYDGETVGSVLGIVRDVTEERRLAEQLVQQEKLAAVGQLVSGVAHELNNPLAGVVAFSQILMASGEGAPEQQQAVEAIHVEARRAARIVQNLLTFARQQRPDRRATDINEVVMQALELRGYSLAGEGIDIVAELDGELPLTWADPFQLQQVFINLFTNAEQALARWDGERRLTVRSWRAEATICVSVSDSGPGVTERDAADVFNPFFTTKGVGEGTGLGLSISDGIVREHGGRIRLESRPGAGAAFIVEIPYAPPPTLPGDEAPSASSAPTRRGVSVLVVDDEPAIRAALTAFLGSLGHAADSVSSGREALSVLACRSYDAILLDLRMPDVSGDTVFEELRVRSPELAGRVIFLTGDTQSESARSFLRDTGRPVLSKPFALDDIAVALAEVVAS
jgi:two-component system, NtrC family, sensor kinase